MEKVFVRDILAALDDLTGGRCVSGPEDYASGKNPFVVTKSSGIPGKAVTEMPGLVCGDPDMEVHKIAVMMTLTESAIELAAATGVNVIITHHPVADGANSGGVLLRTYLNLYHIAVFEVHEAFHGLHPGIPWLHGHKPIYSNICYGGIQGNIIHVGEVLPEIHTIGDIVHRLDALMDLETEDYILQAVRKYRKCSAVQETSMVARGKIILGSEDSKVKKLIHIFPHTGVLPEHIRSIVKEYPDVDTILASISRVYEGNPLLDVARELKLNFVCGNSHAMEIYENGVPLAAALRDHLPEVEVLIFREKIESIPLANVGTQGIRDYGDKISREYLHRKGN
ncbi:MAG: Nif3-like dinuclear metal center hexameric protein [Clostridiales bacterium]|nr:Nif3-like dinuclear metal center hexameric protein [Clostridiales bacterium]